MAVRPLILSSIDAIDAALNGAADGVLLCARHHHAIHDPRYHHSWLPNGTVRFHRRT